VHIELLLFHEQGASLPVENGRLILQELKLALGRVQQ
jgi:hypothetical protein